MILHWSFSEIFPTLKITWHERFPHNSSNWDAQLVTGMIQAWSLRWNEFNECQRSLLFARVPYCSLLNSLFTSVFWWTLKYHKIQEKTLIEDFPKRGIPENDRDPFAGGFHTILQIETLNQWRRRSKHGCCGEMSVSGVYYLHHALPACQRGLLFSVP